MSEYLCKVWSVCLYVLPRLVYFFGCCVKPTVFMLQCLLFIILVVFLTMIMLLCLRFVNSCLHVSIHVYMYQCSACRFSLWYGLLCFSFLIMRELCELSCARLVRYMRSCCLSVATLCLAMFHVSNIFFYSSFQSQRLPISYITMFRLLCLVVTFLEIMF